MSEKKKSLPPRILCPSDPGKKCKPAPEPQLAAAIATIDAARPKGGRPPKYPDKPWLAAGISRMTYYRRQKKGSAKNG